MDSLKQILKSKPSITAVYFNEAGEWMFFPRPGFDKKVDREDALKLKTLSYVDIESPVLNTEQGSDTGTATDALLKKSEDAENFELEKQIFDEQQAEFLAEKQAFDAAKVELNKAIAESTDLKKAATSKDKEIADLKKAATSKDKEIADLKAKIAGLEVAKKDNNPLS